MYPSSNSSSPSQPSRDTNATVNGAHHTGNGLARYRSAPVSFLNSTVDSVINGAGDHMMVGGHHGSTDSRFFSPHDTTSSQQQQQLSSSLDRSQTTTTSFRINEFATAFNGLKSTNQSPPSTLFRHGSSPAGFLNTLASSVPTVLGRTSSLSSQISFAGTSSNFSQMSRDETSHVTNIMDSEEFNFGLSESGLEPNTRHQLPHDSVPCKIRAKRGFATHPRSIAERERRTRISGKLKKLQDLVPNMDKQTSYSDMLDLAVQHIKGLQGHVQNLKKDLENCSCGCKPN